MDPAFLIAGGIAGAVFMLVWFGTREVIALGDKYEAVFTQTAKSNLSDMFIFIEPRKLFILNLVILFVVFILAFLITRTLGLALVVSVIFSLLPRFLWRFLKARRSNTFLNDLPDALLSVSAMMRAGANLNVALETVVAETRGPVGQELGLFLRELRVGVDFDKALDNLAQRTPSQELDLVVAGMKISREVGGSLAEVLYRLAETLRKKLEMEGKIRALTAQGKAQGYVMTLLPVFLVLVLFQIEPEAMSYLFSEWYGWITCAVFITFEYVGYHFIKKIVSIDV